MIGISSPFPGRSQEIIPEVVTPFELSRRLHLRLAGRIPQKAELDQFITDADWDAMVDRLITGEDSRKVREEFWVDLLQMEDPDDLKWIHDQVLKNTPVDKRLHSWFSRQRKPSQTDDDALLYLEKVGKNFFGAGYDCTRCHSHPYENVEQKQFLELAGFFHKNGFVRAPDLYYYDDAKPGEVIPARTPFGPELRITISTRKLEAIRAGEEIQWKVTPAEEFADWLTNFRENPQVLHVVTAGYLDWLWGPHYLAGLQLAGADPMAPPPTKIAEAIRFLKESSFDEVTLLRKLSTHSKAAGKFPPLQMSRIQWVRSIEIALGKEIELDDSIPGPDRPFIEKNAFLDQILNDHPFDAEMDLDVIFLRTLSRLPTGEESAKISKTIQDTALPVSEVYRTIFLSNEFKSIP